MKIKRGISFTEAWKALNEEIETNYIYNLRSDPDFGNTDPDLSFLDALIALRNEYLEAKTDEEQDAAMEKLHSKLIKFLGNSQWKIILDLSNNRRYSDKYMVLTGFGFALDVLFMVLEPSVDIVYASIIADDDI